MDMRRDRIDNIFTMVHNWVEDSPDDFEMATWHHQGMCGTTMCIGGKILYECGYTPLEIHELGGKDETAEALPLLVDIIRNSGYPEFTLSNSIDLFRQTGNLRGRNILDTLAGHEAREDFNKPYLRFVDRLEVEGHYNHGLD